MKFEPRPSKILPPMLRSVAFCIYLLLGVSGVCAGAETAPAAFNPNHVYDLRIELPPEAVSIVKTNSRKWVRATLLEAQTRYNDVGLHLKGQGTFQPLEKKPNFVLKMNQFVPGQRLWGLRKLILNNSLGDSSYLSAFIGNECFRAAGLPAPWCGFARVSLNGRDLGLYVLTEGITQDFLERHFHNHSGNLYQGTIRDIDQELDSNSGDGSPGQPDLKALLAATREPDLPGRLAKMGRVLDLDKFISFMAMEMLLVHGDGYCLRKNNYRIYHDPASNRLVFIPHDMDYLFGDPLKRLNLPMTGLVARAIMEVPAGRKLYVQRVAQLRNSVLKQQDWDERIKQLVSLIRPVLAEYASAAELEHFDRATKSLTARNASRIKFTGEMLADLQRQAQAGDIPLYTNEVVLHR